MKRMRMTVAAAISVAVLGVTANASAASVSLAIDPAQSSVTSVPVTSGGRGYMAPYSLFKFVATVTNDAGQPAVPSGSDYATVDLIARTRDGDKVVSHQTIYSDLPVTFPLQALNQTTQYYARVNAAPANGIAAPANSSLINLRAFLRNYPTAFRSSATRRVTFSGFYAKSEGVSVRRSVRTLIQRRVGTKWVTLARLTPDSTRSWRARVSQGTTPAVFRVRTVPVAPTRFLPVTELRYCIARTLTGAKKLCRSVPLGLNEAGSPTRVITVATGD